ncbi:hypothetical protein ACFLRU_02990 [Bacteroidota bacterium]
MEFIKLKEREIKSENKKLVKVFEQLASLLLAINKKEIPEEIRATINTTIHSLNAVLGTDKELKKQIIKAQASILKLIEKELKLVPKNYYQNTYLVIGMALGMTVVGVPIGTATGNMGLMGIGMCFGMAFGIIVGKAKDKKAFEAGEQLDIEIG